MNKLHFRSALRTIVNKILCLIIGHESTMEGIIRDMPSVPDVRILTEWNCKYCGKFTSTVVNWNRNSAIPMVISKHSVDITSEEVNKKIIELKFQHKWYPY